MHIADFYEAHISFIFPFQGIDLLAGVEAVISHLVVKEFQIPCAHAPALLPVPLSPSLCPKSAAEEVSTIQQNLEVICIRELRDNSEELLHKLENII